MDIRVLQYYLAVVREQSISKAAEKLHISQPTLSVQLRELEEELGKQLLIRGTKGSKKISLTDDGMLLRKRAEEIVLLMEKTRTELMLKDNVIAGNISIGAGETDAVRFVGKVAKEISSIYPDVHYQIHSGNSYYVFEQLDKGLIDFGIIFGEIDHTKYHSIELPFKDIMGVLMRKDAPLAKKELIAASDLWNLPLIVSGQFDSDTFSNILKKERNELNIIATYNLLFNASLLVDEGLGYAIGLDKIINTTGESDLTFRPLSPKSESGLHLIWKKYQVLTKAAKIFIETTKKLYNL